MERERDSLQRALEDEQHKANEKGDAQESETQKEKDKLQVIKRELENTVQKVTKKDIRKGGSDMAEKWSRKAFSNEIVT